MSAKPDGVDVAIAAFFATRFSGGSVEEAKRHAEAMLDFFGVERKASRPNQATKGDGR